MDPIVIRRGCWGCKNWDAQKISMDKTLIPVASWVVNQMFAVDWYGPSIISKSLKYFAEPGVTKKATDTKHIQKSCHNIYI